MEHNNFPPLHELFQSTPRQMLPVHSFTNQSFVKLKQNETNQFTNKNTRAALSKRINPGYYQLSYLIARIRWNIVITVFHTLKYNKKQTKKEQYRTNVIHRTDKNIELLKLCQIIIKIQIKMIVKHKKIVFKRMKQLLSNFKAKESFELNSNQRFIYKQKSEKHKQIIQSHTTKKDYSTKMQQFSSSSITPYEKVTQSNFNNKNKQTQKYKQLDRRLQQLETLLDNTKKYRAIETDRRQRIQEMLLQQRVNRFQSQSKSKSKSRLKSNSQSKQISKFRFQKQKVKQASNSSYSKSKNHYNRNSSNTTPITTSPYQLNSVFIQSPHQIQNPNLITPTTQQPIFYQIIQPIYINQPNPIYYSHQQQKPVRTNHSASRKNFH